MILDTPGINGQFGAALGRGGTPPSQRESFEAPLDQLGRTEHLARRPVRFDPVLWNLETGSKGLREVIQCVSAHCSG